MARILETDSLSSLVLAARAGDTAACGKLVEKTQAMALAVAAEILRDPSHATDAAQQAYLRAFRRLGDLQDPAAFAPWLRRIVITTALNLQRTHRRTFLRLDDMPEVPMLDEAESRWSDAQRHRLSAALLALTAEERRACDRRYHGGWSVTRLAAAAGVDEVTMRKRLQRIRSKLRRHIETEEIEMASERGIDPNDTSLPGKVIELLARPQLTDLPENPVGRVLDVLRGLYADFTPQELPEIVNLTEARRSVANEALYLEPGELHHVDADRILRYDLTLPLLLSVRYEGQPLRVYASGKTYRSGHSDATHLEAFHQLDALWMDEQAQLDPWTMTARVLQSVDRLLPGRAVKMAPTHYPMCTQAWDLSIDDNGQWTEVLAWGVFTDRIVIHLGGDPSRHTAVGVGYGLERLAMLRYGIDDIRKIDVAKVA